MSQKLNAKIHVLIVENELDNFTLLEIRKAHEKAFDDIPSASEVRKFLYRQIYRLVKEGLLVKNGLHNSQNITYSKTPLFMDKFQSTSTAESKNHNVDCSITAIEQKLVSYKVDLSASIAESEEYQQFSKENPHLGSVIYEKLQSSRERSSRLLGQVKAMENIKAIISGASNET
tara:strand:+ start:2015 stop:2536 length:522 start_codon:yes stop_codon:yes gene_type:complete